MHRYGNGKKYSHGPGCGCSLHGGSKGLLSTKNGIASPKLPSQIKQNIQTASTLGKRAANFYESQAIKAAKTVRGIPQRASKALPKINK